MKVGSLVKMRKGLLEKRHQNYFDELDWSGRYLNEEICDMTDQLWEKDEKAVGVIVRLFEEEPDNAMREIVTAFYPEDKESRDELLQNRDRIMVFWNNEDIVGKSFYREDLVECSPKQLIKSYIKTTE